MGFDIVERGRAVCIYEPRGDNGLEGFQLNDVHRYVKVHNTCKDSYYYRVFPERTGYYETCGPIVFSRYFKKVEG